jgi:hypothetical protein
MVNTMVNSEKSSRPGAGNKRSLSVGLGVIFALCCGLTGCAKSDTTADASPKAFPAPPAMVDAKINQIQDPAIRMKVMADMSHMRAAASGNVPAPGKQ